MAFTSRFSGCFGIRVQRVVVTVQPIIERLFGAGGHRGHRVGWRIGYRVQWFDGAARSAETAVAAQERCAAGGCKKLARLGRENVFL